MLTLSEADRLLCYEYRHGVRTAETRAAWARRGRLQRQAHIAKREEHERLNPGVRYVASGIKHGAGGYQHFGCRCKICYTAMKTAAIMSKRAVPNDVRRLRYRNAVRLPV